MDSWAMMECIPFGLPTLDIFVFRDRPGKPLRAHVTAGMEGRAF